MSGPAHYSLEFYVEILPKFGKFFKDLLIKARENYTG